MHGKRRHEEKGREAVREREKERASERASVEGEGGGRAEKRKVFFVTFRNGRNGTKLGF